jgi:superfamily II DNA or RNA helicase
LNPGLPAKELAKKLGLSKSEINPVLYGSAIFARTADSAPRWFLAADGPVPAPVMPPSEKAAAPAPSEETEAEGRARLASIEKLVKELFESAPDEDEEAMLARFIKSDTSPRVVPPTIVATEDNPFALYDWQREALDQWKLRESKGIVDAVTGAGKTRLAVAAVAEHVASGGAAVVLVPTVVLLHQWREVLVDALPSSTRIGLVGDGHRGDAVPFDVLIAVIASARTRHFDLAGRVGLLVVDECHRSASEKNREALDERFAKRLGLSATHERLDDLHETILLPYFRRVVFRLNYERAIADGVITNVRTAFVGVDFTEEEKNAYAQLQQQLSSLRRKLVNEWGCRPKPFSAFLDDVLRLIGTGGTMKGGIVANRWLTTWRAKKELLAETPAKQEAVALLTPAVVDADRTLLFTQSIKSADRLHELLGEQGVSVGVHHSGIDTSERESILADFAAGRYRVLTSVQTLEEGVDVPDADLAVIVASSKQRRQMIQRMGRVMRRKPDGRDARFVILYVNGTDEDPRLGAHELFVEELLAVARESQLFTLNGGGDELRSFLDPRRVD